MIFESAGALRASERRSDPPGVRSKRRNKPSTYGEGLIEKQKIKYYYGFGEKQLRRFFAKAARKTGNTGDIFLIECELRLDNVVRRSGFTKTRPQARQGIVHGHFDFAQWPFSYNPLFSLFSVVLIFWFVLYQDKMNI